MISAAGGNTPTTSLLDDDVFQTTVLVSEYYRGKIPLPAHDIVFNAIGDADLCGEGLDAARTILARTRRPVINHPGAVFRTARLANADRLRRLPHVVTPRMARLPRRVLSGTDAGAIVASHGFSFPLLARAPGFHTGHHFIRAKTLEELAAAVERFPGDDVWLIEQLDTRDSEGFFRKLRVMIVDGKPYPLHLAISRQWKVHYYTADMADCAANRAKERKFLDDMAGAVGKRGMLALERICAALDLDYGGIDFALNARDDILLFEANATMVMVPLSVEAKWDYRRPAFDRVFAAVRTMLLERAAAGDSRSAIFR